jgi:hypothetical protein
MIPRPLSMTLALCAVVAVILPGAWSAEDRLTPLGAPLPAPAPAEPQDHLGFVVHTHAEGAAEYPQSGARTMLANLFFWNMRDEERRLVDFAPAEDWLRWLYRDDLYGVPIIDTSMHHTSITWRSEHTKALGENVHDAGGVQQIYSSPFSPAYREMVEQYIADLTGWISKNDTAGRVTTYVNGAEVFWPGMLDYGPLAQTAFREWLAGRYGDVAAVNERWGASFATMQEVVPVPVYRSGQPDFGPNAFNVGAWMDASWLRKVEGVTPGGVLDVSAEVRAADIHDNGATVLVLHQDGDDRRHVDCIGVQGVTGEDWVRLARRIRVPAWATETALLLSLQTPGTAEWRDARVTDAATGAVLLETDGPDAWSFALWSGDMKGDTVANDDGTVLRLTGTPTPWPCERPQAAWHDFHTFSMETYAQLMNHWAQRIRHHDPSREVMHYLGFLLGTLGQWDDLMQTQRADIFLANAPDVDIHGLQLPAANGDFHPATAVLDLARKYGKPMVATDLQDFTHGLHVGFHSLNRTSLACVASGMDGAYYYDWMSNAPREYDWFQNWTMDETRRMLDGFRSLQAFTADATIDTRTAFLLPLLPWCSADPDGRKSDILDAMGWYKLLRHAGAIPDVYTPYELETGDWDLSRHEAVVVPDCPFLPVAAAAKLRAYAGAGGVIIFGGRPPAFDETGCPLPEPFAGSGLTLPTPGEERIGSGRVVFTGAMDGRTWLGPLHRTNVAGNTPPMYLPDPQRVEPLLLASERDRLARNLRDLLEASEALPPAWIETADTNLDIAVYETADSVRAVLIHKGDGQHYRGALIARGVTAQEIEVRADFEARPVKTTVLPDGTCKLELPAFTDVCTVQWRKR